MMEKAAFKAGFQERTTRAREEAGLSQEQLAKALGLSQGTYKQYETRSMLPTHLIERFAIITRTDPWFLLTGSHRSMLKANIKALGDGSIKFIEKK